MTAQEIKETKQFDINCKECIPNEECHIFYNRVKVFCDRYKDKSINKLSLEQLNG